MEWASSSINSEADAFHLQNMQSRWMSTFFRLSLSPETHAMWSSSRKLSCYRGSYCYSQICSVLTVGLYLLLECVAYFGHINDTQCGTHPIRREKT